MSNNSVDFFRIFYRFFSEYFLGNSQENLARILRKILSDPPKNLTLYSELILSAKCLKSLNFLVEPASIFSWWTSSKKVQNPEYRVIFFYFLSLFCLTEVEKGAGQHAFTVYSSCIHCKNNL